MEAAPDRWTVLLTGENHGLVREYGNQHEGSPAHYPRVNVVREDVMLKMVAARISPEACTKLLEACERLILVIGIAGVEAKAEIEFAQQAISEAKV